MFNREIVGNAVDYRKKAAQDPKQYRSRNIESPDSPDEEPTKHQYHATLANAPKGSLGAGLASLQKRELLSNQLIAKQKELNNEKVCSTKLAKRVITQQVPTLVHKGPKIIKRKIDNPQEVQVARRYGEGIRPIFEHKDVVVNPEPSTSRSHEENSKFVNERSTRGSERYRPVSPTSPSTGGSSYSPPHSYRRRGRSSDNSPVHRPSSPRVSRNRRPISPRGPRSPSNSPKSFKRTRSPKSPRRSPVRRPPSPSPPKKLPYYVEPKREMDRLKTRARSRSRTRSPVFPSRRRRSRSRSRSRNRSRDRQPVPVAPQIIVLTQPGFDYSYMDPNWLMHGMRPPFRPPYGPPPMHPNFQPRMPGGFQPGYHPNAQYFGPRPPPYFGPRQRQPFFRPPDWHQ